MFVLYNGQRVRMYASTLSLFSGEDLARMPEGFHVREEPDDPEILAHPTESPARRVERQRREAYEAAGCTVEALAVAMWEKVAENRPEALDALQAMRAAVKARFPKG